MAGRLEGKVCLISGVGAGLGREASLLFAHEGAKVVGCGRNPDAVMETARMVAEAGGTMAVIERKVDLREYSECQAYVAFGEETFGGIDVLYNNAGRASNGFMHDPDTIAAWDRCVHDEFDVPFYLAHAAWHALIRRGGGSIINVGSLAAYKGSMAHGMGPHMACKAGVIAMCKQLALEGGPHGIRVNSLSPGPTLTENSAKFLNDPAYLEESASRRILGRWGVPSDIANYALFLASDESAFITGTDMLIDGGYSLA